MDIWPILVLTMMFSGCTAQSSVNFYNCKSISVSGIVIHKHLNGIYEKVFECNYRSMYRMKGSQNKFLFYLIQNDYWALGQPSDLTSDCSDLTSSRLVIGIGNKLYPHMVERVWQEYNGVIFQPNPGITVQCDDVFWSMGCSYMDFPINKTKCYNATSAIDVQNVYVVNFEPGTDQFQCARADSLCAYLGDCGLEKLHCKRAIPTDEYEYKLVHSHCDGRHVQCHPFKIDPLFHINCDTGVQFPCDRSADVRDGILLEYKCKKSYKYIDPGNPVEDVGSQPKQNRLGCTTTQSPGLAPSDENEQQSDSTLIQIVAPAASVLFFVIILAVIIATLRKRRNRSRQKPDNNTYANITSLGANPSQEAKKRPDIAEKKPKRAQPNGNISPQLKPAVDAFMDANPNLKSADGAKDGMFTVFILDPEEVPNGTQVSRVPNGDGRQHVSQPAERYPGVHPSPRHGRSDPSMGRPPSLPSTVTSAYRPQSLNNAQRQQTHVFNQPNSGIYNGKGLRQGSNKPNSQKNRRDKKNDKKSTKKDEKQRRTAERQATLPHQGHLPPVESISRSSVGYNNRAYTT